MHGGVVVHGDDVDAPDDLLRRALRAGTVGPAEIVRQLRPDAPARFSRRAETERRVAGTSKPEVERKYAFGLNPGKDRRPYGFAPRPW